MGDFSLFVRQELPNAIRPQKPQPAARTTTENTDFAGLGFAVLAGGSGTVVDLNYSYSASFSRSMEQEKERMVDTVRVKQKKKNPATGKEEISEENYIDVDVPTQLEMVSADGTENLYKFGKLPSLDNVEVLEGNIKQSNPDYVPPSPAADSGGGTSLVRTVKINRRPIRRRR